MEALDTRTRAIAEAIARAAMPPGRFLEQGGEGTVRRLESWVRGASVAQMVGLRALLLAGEVAPLPFTGHTLRGLEPALATRFLERWAESGSHAGRALLRAILTPLKAAHFDDPQMFAHVGCSRPETSAAHVAETPRWMQRVTDGRQATLDLSLECEVVVVGTGAGGAAAAYELASRGRAVLLLEEGDFHRRESFGSRASQMYRRLYRDGAMTFALGNVGVPVWAGRAVGGSTVINSGTCYRAPERTLRTWADELGLEMFSRAMLDPYYARVESMLGVARASASLTGGVGRVVARGAEALGYRHEALLRNAPDCDGQGVCCFGCPTGAKRSTDVSYIPEALKRGAELVTAAHVRGVDVVNGRAVGVRGTLGSGHTFAVKAEAVVVAGGALMTPLLLRGVLKSPWLGKNLSIHPASKVMAVFDETIDMARGIPQGYAVNEFADEGIMFEGASTPLDVTAVAVPWVGHRFTELMESYRNVATFGFMIQDTSRGRVRRGAYGSPLVTYDLNLADTAKMSRAIAILCELFLASGARRVAPMVAGMEEIRSMRDVERLRGMKLRPGDFEVTAYHPLGTCRMGVDPRTSLVGPDHESFDVKGLYVTDGSAIPTALGVNPQMTIMAMALRAAEIIDRRLS